MVEVTFTNAALDDLRRLGPDAVPKVLRKVLLLLNNPKAGYPLGGELAGYRKLIVGPNTWRVVYLVNEGSVLEICEVWAVGERADAQVYAEATARVRAAGTSSPEFLRLADVIERLGKLAGNVIVSQRSTRDPVPDWLSERLIYTVGLSREDVVALDLERAVDLWADYTSNPGRGR